MGIGLDGLDAPGTWTKLAPQEAALISQRWRCRLIRGHIIGWAALIVAERVEDIEPWDAMTTTTCLLVLA